MSGTQRRPYIPSRALLNAARKGDHDEVNRLLSEVAACTRMEPPGTGIWRFLDE